MDELKNRIQKIKKIAGTFLILLFLSGLLQKARAQNLEAYLLEAANQNIALKVLFTEYKQALERVPQASALPDPLFSFGYCILPISTRNGDTQFDLGIQQSLPWFGKLKAEKNLAVQIAETKYNEFISKRDELYYSVSQNWYEIYQLDQQIRINRDNVQLLEYIENLATHKYETGLATMVDILRIQLKERDVENRINSLRLQRQPLEVTFNNMLNRSVDESIELPEVVMAIDEPLVNWVDSILTNNKQLKVLESQKEEAHRLEKVARLAGKPDLGVGVRYTNINRVILEGTPIGDHPGRDILIPAVTFTLPIHRKKYQAIRKEAAFNLEAVQQKEIVVKQVLMEDYAQTKFLLNDAQLSIDLNEEQLEQGRQALDLLLRQAANDRVDFDEILRLQQELLNYELDLISAKVNKNIAVARLNQLASRTY